MSNPVSTGFGFEVKESRKQVQSKTGRGMKLQNVTAAKTECTG